MPASSAPPYVFPHFTKVVMVLDVVESVRLMEKDELGFIQRWHEFVEYATGSVISRHGGRMHKSLGDGLMLEFSDAQGSIRAALELQAWSKEPAHWLRTGEGMPLRVGAHLAEFVADQHDIYGTDVNLTARIAGLAGPGEIVVTPALRDCLATGLDGDIEDLGECFLKHVKEPIRLYRVGPAGHAPVIDTGSCSHIELRPSIAVIPFTVQGAELGQQIVGEALADEVIAALSRTSELHVISRLSTTVFRGRQDRPTDIRSHLGATYVLTGNCRVAGGQMGIFVELIDARTSHITWADSMKAEIPALFGAHELVTSIVSAVTTAVMTRELQRARGQPLPTLEAYTLMLGAVSLMHRNRRSDFERARQCLEHLVERARRHPTPYAWLAQWHVLKVQQGWSADPGKEGAMALEQTKRALDNDPDCALAVAAEGFVYTNLLRDLDSGLKRYELALSLNPNDSLANLLKGTLHAFRGEGQAAVQSTERALTLSPLDPIRYFYDSLAASAAVAAGDYERAIELARRSLRANRTHTSTYRALAIAQSLADRMDEARLTVQELLKLEPDYTVTQFVSRSPSSAYPIGQVYADALGRAGLPQ